MPNEERTTLSAPDARKSFPRRLRWLLLRYGFPLSLLCLVALGFATFAADADVEEATEWRRQGFQVRRMLDDLRVQLNVHEREQRSFVITGDSSDLQRYALTRRYVDHDLEQLHRNLSDPAQRRLLARLTPLVRLLLDRLNETLETRQREGFEAARRSIAGGRGKALMDEISELAQTLEESQTALIVQREKDLRASLERSRWSVLAGTVGSILLLTLVYRRLVVRMRERNQMVGLLRDANAAAEAANTAKSELLANMSREIQLPMTGVVGVLERALETELTPRQRGDLETAHGTAESVLTMVQDVLDLSHLEAGKLLLDRRDFLLSDCMDEVLSRARPAAQAKGLQLTSHVDPGLPRVLTGDPDRLRQIVLKLVQNALKFTDYGEVVVRITAEEIAADWARLHFAITGVCIGLPSARGTGLGLTLASHLIERMEGRTWVDGTMGIGSTFHFSLRFGVAAEAAAPSAPAVRQSASLRILLAEDNPLNEAFLVSLLVNQGHRVGVAQNGREAVGKAAAGAFDLILMDVQMPEMDGLQAATAIRRQEAESGSHVPIVALTASAMKGDRERCLAAGMDHYLAKPVRARELVDLLARIMTEPRAWSDRACAAAP